MTTHQSLQRAPDHDARGAARGLIQAPGVGSQHGTPPGDRPAVGALSNGALARAVAARTSAAPSEALSRAEAAFDTSFRGLQLHEDADLRRRGALGQAQGDSVRLAPGELARPEGPALLGHELAHVVQQRQGRVPGVAGQITRDPALEQEAHAAGRAFAQGRPLPSALRGAHGAQTAAGVSPVQRFDTPEHKSLGDDATGGKTYDMSEADSPAVGASNYNANFKLTHGDILALSGDYFSPRDTIQDPATGQETANPDGLFVLASVPSVKPGQLVGTRDEILCALKEHSPNDARFDGESCRDEPEAGLWAGVTFSEEVKASVNERYLRLAARNDEHFVDPTGAGGVPESGDGASAGGSYRSLHEDAIKRACAAGASGQGVDMAMAREAAAQHYLTDSFAAGHIRTPRGSIREHWRAKYPLFWKSFQEKIALDVAIWINSNEWAGRFKSVDQLYVTIRKKVLESAKSKPPMGFDDLVSLVTHDFDNENGLWVVNDLGDRWQTFGDKHLDDDYVGPKKVCDGEADTRTMAEIAVSLGIEDITHAHGLGIGSGGQGLPDQQLFSAVRAQTTSPAKAAEKYGAEQVVPQLDDSKEAENGKQQWEAASAEDLWDTTVTTSTKVTFGSAITESLKGGELYNELAGMAEQFPRFYSEDKEKGDDDQWDWAHPRKAYEEGFLKALQANPKKELLDVIHFSPTRGQADQNKDDAVMREIKGDKEAGFAEMKDEEMRAFTLLQRAERVRALIGGAVAADEGAVIVRMFSTASAGDRPLLFQMIEGHAWSDDFLPKDRLVQQLKPAQSSAIKEMLNAK